MPTIQHVTPDEFLAHFARYANEVTNSDTNVVIDHPANKGVVLISTAEFNSLQETNYLLASRANRAVLAHSIAQAERGKGKPLTPAEFRSLTKPT